MKFLKLIFFFCTFSLYLNLKEIKRLKQHLTEQISNFYTITSNDLPSIELWSIFQHTKKKIHDNAKNEYKITDKKYLALIFNKKEILPEIYDEINEKQFSYQNYIYSVLKEFKLNYYANVSKGKKILIQEIKTNCFQNEFEGQSQLVCVPIDLSYCQESLNILDQYCLFDYSKNTLFVTLDVYCDQIYQSGKQNPNYQDKNKIYNKIILNTILNFESLNQAYYKQWVSLKETQQKEIVTKEDQIKKSKLSKMNGFDSKRNNQLSSQTQSQIYYNDYQKSYQNKLKKWDSNCYNKQKLNKSFIQASTNQLTDLSLKKSKPNIKQVSNTDFLSKKKSNFSSFVQNQENYLKELDNKVNTQRNNAKLVNKSVNYQNSKLDLDDSINDVSIVPQTTFNQKKSNIVQQKQNHAQNNEYQSSEQNTKKLRQTKNDYLNKQKELIKDQNYLLKSQNGIDDLIKNQVTPKIKSLNRKIKIQPQIYQYTNNLQPNDNSKLGQKQNQIEVKKKEYKKCKACALDNSNQIGLDKNRGEVLKQPRTGSFYENDDNNLQLNKSTQTLNSLLFDKKIMPNNQKEKKDQYSSQKNLLSKSFVQESNKEKNIQQKKDNKLNGASENIDLNLQASDEKYQTVNKKIRKNMNQKKSSSKFKSYLAKPNDQYQEKTNKNFNMK